MKILSLITVAVFWISLAGIIYAYFIYPLVLFAMYAVLQLRRDLKYLVRRNERRTGTRVQELPPVTFIVPAHNEEEHLEEKLQNIRELDYPRDRLQVVIVSDGSTDRTNEILRSVTDSNVEIIFQEPRAGKPVALNRAVERARGDILVFSDASTMFAPDAVQKLVRHFARPSVGAVCGALRFKGSSESQQTEGVYWKYESMLRLMEARLGATLTASGAIHALRRQAYRALPPETVLDDFVIPMNARRLGLAVVYDPEATATDYAASSVAGEFKRRVRIAVGSFRALRNFLDVPMSWRAMFAFLSHKLMRWVVPVFLVLLLLTNIALVTRPFYAVMLLLQVAFYIWAGAGFLFRNRLQGVRFALVGYFLLAMNAAFLVGLIRVFSARKEGTWQRVS